MGVKSEPVPVDGESEPAEKAEETPLGEAEEEKKDE